MGQKQSSPIQDFLAPLVAQILSEEPAVTLLTEEIHTLTYDQFLALLNELNSMLSKNCLDEEGRQLVFAVKKGTDSTVFWKGTVQIACVRVDPETKNLTYRLLNLPEFLKVCKTLKNQSSAVEQSQSSNQSSPEKSKPSENDLQKECCICLERKQEVILPCAHSYCLPCIEEWNESHDTCPICRQKLESTDDTWVLSEVPNAEEICRTIQSDLMKLAEHTTSDDDSD